VEQGKGATSSPTDDLITVLVPRQRVAPGSWSRRVRTTSLPSPAPNMTLEATGHSVGLFSVRVSVRVTRASACALDCVSTLIFASDSDSCGLCYY
jgi:hypothetical protein